MPLENYLLCSFLCLIYILFWGEVSVFFYKVELYTVSKLTFVDP